MSMEGLTVSNLEHQPSTSAEEARKRTQYGASGSSLETRPKSAEGAVRSTGDDGSASAAPSSMVAHLKELVDHQIASGRGAVGVLANSAMRAAGDLEKDAPQLAGFVREAASQLNGVVKGMEDRSIDELVRAASAYTRRQPALVFGLAAVAGFLAMRTVRAASPAHSNGARAHGTHAHG